MADPADNISLVRVHIKNNRWAAGSFPNTPEGEAVFTITQQRFQSALSKFPDLEKRIAVTIDWDTDNFATHMADADVLLTWNLPLENLGGVAPQCRWIHIIGAGVEHLLPMDWLPPGLTLTNNKGVHAAKAAEFGLMSILMLHCHMPKLITNQHNRRYDSLYSTPIAGKTLVVVGTGSLGGSAAAKLSALGMHVIGVNRSGREVDGIERVVPTSELDHVLGLADYLFLATPDTPQTQNLMSRQRLQSLKPGAGIVNIGRQSVMDYDALCDLLESGAIGGAILDVFDPEPIDPASRLWTTPNLVITPHVSADDGDHYVEQTLQLFFRNMQRYVAGEPFLNAVDPVAGY